MQAFTSQRIVVLSYRKRIPLSSSDRKDDPKTSRRGTLRKITGFQTRRKSDRHL